MLDIKQETASTGTPNYLLLVVALVLVLWQLGQ